MTRRKLKDDGKRVTDKGRIPNVEALLKEVGGAKPVLGTDWYAIHQESTDAYIARKVSEATERGRTIGRLEAMMDTFALPWNESVRINIAPSERTLLIPIIKAEVERLRAKP